MYASWIVYLCRSRGGRASCGHVVERAESELKSNLSSKVRGRWWLWYRRGTPQSVLVKMAE